MRLLGAVRLSSLTDESTSPVRQREQIEGWGKLHRHTLAAITEDLDVSGAVSPFERPELGPWLTDPAKIALWDALIISKFDRLGRSQRDYLDLIEWTEANGKALVSVAESLDFSTPTDLPPVARTPPVWGQTLGSGGR
jgi:DNA invertase Pin-like site-specific DNA recombinase